MKKWIQIERYAGNMNEEDRRNMLECMGEGGWELAAIAWPYFYFKREASDATDSKQKILQVLERIADGIDRQNQL